MRGVSGPIIGSLVFLGIAPGTVAVWVPWQLCRWRFERPFFGWAGSRLAGVLLVFAGAAVLLDSFARFALQGRGTPAPPLPTQRLVVSGLYRYVRNPMYVGVVCAIMGQACLFGSRVLAYYGAAVWLCFWGFVVMYEEPTLRERYGDEYARYCAGVRRWLPRFTPWTVGADGEGLAAPSTEKGPHA